MKFKYSTRNSNSYTNTKVHNLVARPSSCLVHAPIETDITQHDIKLNKHRVDDNGDDTRVATIATGPVPI